MNVNHIICERCGHNLAAHWTEACRHSIGDNETCDCTTARFLILSREYERMVDENIKLRDALGTIKPTYGVVMDYMQELQRCYDVAAKALGENK